MNPFGQHKTLEQLNDDEWERLCDGCALCCLNKLMDEDTDEILYTNVACNQLNIKNGQCKHYDCRFQYEPDCIQLTKQNLSMIEWLPKTCSYRYFSEHQRLPDWHPFNIGDQSQMKQQNIGIPKDSIHEKDVLNWADHIITD